MRAKRIALKILGEIGYDPHPHVPHYEGGKREVIETHKILPTEASREYYRNPTDPETRKRIDGLREHIRAGGATHPIAVRKIPAGDIKRGEHLGMKLNGETHAVIEGHHRWAAHGAEGTTHMSAVVNPRSVE